MENDVKNIESPKKEYVYKATVHGNNGEIYRNSGNLIWISHWVDKMLERDDVYYAEVRVMK